MNEAYEVLTHIAEDMLEPVSYLPLGIAAGAVFLAGYEVWKRICGRREAAGALKPAGKDAGHPGGGRRSRGWILTLCVVYGTVLLYLAFFSREPGSRKGIDLMLFETWKDSPVAKAFVIENVLMFIPFGILVPAAFPRCRKGMCCTAAGFTCSVCLELAQLVTQRGHCQLDDVVMNTLGTWIGWMVYRILSRMRGGRRMENADS